MRLYHSHFRTNQPSLDHHLSTTNIPIFLMVNLYKPLLVGGIPTPLKNLSQSVGMINYSQYMESHNPNVPVTTKQIKPWLFPSLHPSILDTPSRFQHLADDARPLGVQLGFALQAMPHLISFHQGRSRNCVFFFRENRPVKRPTNKYGDIIWI